MMSLHLTADLRDFVNAFACCRKKAGSLPITPEIWYHGTEI